MAYILPLNKSMLQKIWISISLLIRTGEMENPRLL
jgi:hypothetical protein